MARIVYPEFRDELAPTKYPFAETALLVNESNVEIPSDMFLDARLYPIGGQAGLYLSRIVMRHDKATIYVSDPATDEICSGDVDFSETPSSVSLVDVYDRPAGVLVSDVNRLASLRSVPIGDHRFERTEAEFAASVCVPTPELGVRGLLLPDGTLLTGDVWIVGDDGVILRAEDVTVATPTGSKTYQVIRCDVVGDPLFKRRLCEDRPELFQAPRFITSFKIVYGDDEFVVTPDELGNIPFLVGTTLTSKPILRVRATANGLLFATAGATLEESGA